CQQHHSHPLTF
nr:immunoglobulin light chain junction region [Macaca mulatta]MOW55589.1 immunoglobulin light chain junction region [Macaca mulatta]